MLGFLTTTLRLLMTPLHELIKHNVVKPLPGGLA